MSKWDEMSARERDAWVHVAVFNAPQPTDSRGKKWGEMCPAHRKVDCCNRLTCPHYTTDAADDYLVLCKVREEWAPDSEQFCEFCEYLNQLQSNRARSYTLRGYSYSGANYQPGDYAHAAFLTLEGA